MRVHLGLFQGDDLVALRQAAERFHAQAGPHSSPDRQIANLASDINLIPGYTERLRALLPPCERGYIQAQLFFNYYTGRYKLNWHTDGFFDHMFLICVSPGHGPLCFARSPEPNCINVDYERLSAEFSLYLQAGDVVQWSGKEQEDLQLCHAGIFRDRITLVTRFNERKEPTSPLFINLGGKERVTW